MKKSIFLAAFGLATVVVSSRGQGYVYFSSYSANDSDGALTSLVSNSGTTPLPAGFTADLYYALGTVSDPVNFNSYSSTVSLPTGLIDLGVHAAYDSNGDGYFTNPLSVAIPGYTGGPITFEVVAYNGSSYYDALNRGRSGSFTMNSIATSPFGPAPNLGDNGAPMPDFFVYNESPEPATLALASLGGLVSFVAFRRQQS